MLYVVLLHGMYNELVDQGHPERPHFKVKDK